IIRERLYLSGGGDVGSGGDLDRGGEASRELDASTAMGEVLPSRIPIRAISTLFTRARLDPVVGVDGCAGGIAVSSSSSLLRPVNILKTTLSKVMGGCMLRLWRAACFFSSESCEASLVADEEAWGMYNCGPGGTVES